jgi:ferredoxin-thioredoxin reductase catalytic chain
MVDDDILDKNERAELAVRLKSLAFTIQEGCIFNPDLVSLGKIYTALARNIIKHGEPYCPCRVIVLGKDNLHNICPCSSAKNEILSNGHCKCRLFFAAEKEK